MNNLVIYYTYKGNTEIVAKEISNLIGGDLIKIEELKTPKDSGLFWMAFSALIGLKSKIKEIDFNIKKYDNIFIGGQVWAGRTTPAINSLLGKADFGGKNVYLFLTQADDKEQYKVIQSVTKRVEKHGGKMIDSFFIQTKMESVITPELAAGKVSDWIRKLKV
ncbi:MAG: flavodoxin/nitric oxide synthase [Clostridia bacterium]|nr:flavodoxin/nitric oxide synthase [Clostridia bacterium]